MNAEIKQSSISDAELVQRVDAELSAFLVSRSLPTELHKAIDYAVFSNGKRIRPLLCLRVCGAVCGYPLDALAAAASVELIHTFSLVHDDLPAMDDDDMRRGRPTLHKQTSEAMAILAGDTMTALAFELLQERVEYANVHIGELSRATRDMIAGQVYDTMGGQPGHLAPIEQLRLTHRYKTGALLRASVMMGATLGAAGPEQLDVLTTYADAIGLMFQAVDDLLDVTQSADKMGKATGKDAEQGKLTYPGLLGIDGTRAEIEKLRSQAIDALSIFDSKADPLREMAERLAKRER